MTRKVWVSLTVLAATLGLVGSAVRAELPSGSYDSLRKKAREAVILEVETVKTKELAGGWTEVVVTARVVSVERSKAGLKKGAKVTIRYERFDTTKGNPPPGPTPVPVLEKGEIYPAFLDQTEGKREFQPAAAGWSFSMTPED